MTLKQALDESISEISMEDLFCVPIYPNMADTAVHSEVTVGICTVNTQSKLSLLATVVASLFCSAEQVNSPLSRPTERPKLLQDRVAMASAWWEHVDAQMIRCKSRRAEHISRAAFFSVSRTI